MEIWIDAFRFPSYEVSSYGRVRNKKNDYILRPHSDRYGYLRVSLGNEDNVYIHRLVAESFLGLPEHSNYQVNHIDGDRQNNHIHNLEWCSPSENIKWGIYKGNINPNIGLEKAREINLKPVRIVELDRIFSSVKECADFLGVQPTNVSRCISGSRAGQKLHGYHIEYVEEDYQ